VEIPVLIFEDTTASSQKSTKKLLVIILYDNSPELFKYRLRNYTESLWGLVVQQATSAWNKLLLQLRFDNAHYCSAVTMLKVSYRLFFLITKWDLHEINQLHWFHVWKTFHVLVKLALIFSVNQLFSSKYVSGYTSDFLVTCNNDAVKNSQSLGCNFANDSYAVNPHDSSSRR